MHDATQKQIAQIVDSDEAPWAAKLSERKRNAQCDELQQAQQVAFYSRPIHQGRTNDYKVRSGRRMDPSQCPLSFPFRDSIRLNRRRGIRFREGTASRFIAVYTDATHKYETPDMLFRCSLRQLSSCIYVDGAIE